MSRRASTHRVLLSGLALLATTILTVLLATPLAALLPADAARSSRSAELAAHAGPAVAGDEQSPLQDTSVGLLDEDDRSDDDDLVECSAPAPRAPAVPPALERDAYGWRQHARPPLVHLDPPEPPPRA